MNAIQQTVQIPADRRLRLDFALPDDFPLGEATVLVLPPVSPKNAYESIKHLAGCLADSKTFAGDPVAIQRALRDEW
ncbi:MAG: hypothetical protein FWH34_01710 [Desulfovibrionaceae bacterium]|nr:hypothetical protein [Desulfovibrionaceae bacterium]